VAEGGFGDTFTVALASRPTAAVTVTLASGDQLAVTSPALIFTPDNWNIPQSVSVTAVNDRVAEGGHAGIVTYMASGSDPRYAGLAGTAVSVAIADNDTAGVMVMPSGGWTALTEDGGADTYTVVLTSRPASDVTVSLTPGAQVSAKQSQLTFTSADWDVPKTVTISAADDSLVEGGHTGAVSHTASSADTAYNGVIVADLVALITDNDSFDLEGDLNGDGRVGLHDLVIMQQHFGTTGIASPTNGDLDGDHDVDAADLARLVANFGRTTAASPQAVVAARSELRADLPSAPLHARRTAIRPTEREAAVDFVLNQTRLGAYRSPGYSRGN
jgi:hypothetical protein